MGRVKICCSKCGRRLFDYISGNVELEMKCERCKRVVLFKSCSEKMIQKDHNGYISI